MTIKLTRMQVFYISLAMMLLGLLIYKLSFIIGSETTTGEVVGIKSWSTRGRYPGSYSAPVVKFNAQKHDITFQGETNMDIQYGEKVTVIYKTDDPTDAFIYSFVGFWLVSLMYCSIFYLLLIATAIFSYLKKDESLRINISRKMMIHKTKDYLINQ